MRIRLIAVGNKMPGWVNDGYEEYAGRMPHECRLELVELKLPERTKNSDISKLMALEAELIVGQLKPAERLLALDVKGRNWSTEQLSIEMQRWRQDGRDIALIVGGPDGIDPALLAKAELKWSLSALTLPHPLVRIVVAEALYRAHTLLSNHPYHRA